MASITPRPTITRMSSFSVVSVNYMPLAEGFTTRKTAVRVAVSYGIIGGARVIQGGYDDDGERYFREVFPRVRRTWQHRFKPSEMGR